MFVGQRIIPGQLTVVALAAALIVLVVSLLARPLRRAIQEAIDRLFYRETYWYRRALTSFSTSAGTIIDLEQLADRMLPAVRNALRITEARLMFQQNGGGEFTTQFTFPKSDDHDSLTFSLDNLLVDLL